MHLSPTCTISFEPHYLVMSQVLLGFHVSDGETEATVTQLSSGWTQVWSHASHQN